jgi:hypothetical protein
MIGPKDRVRLTSPFFGLLVLGDLGAEGEKEEGVVHAEPRSR